MTKIKNNSFVRHRGTANPIKKSKQNKIPNSTTKNKQDKGKEYVQSQCLCKILNNSLFLQNENEP